MDEFEVKNRESFQAILNRGSKSDLSSGFTKSLMESIGKVELKNRVFKKYMNRSVGLFILTILLALTSAFVFANIEITFQGYVNNFVSKTFSIFIYALISILSGFIFYQLNNLLTYRFDEVK